MKDIKRLEEYRKRLQAYQDEHGEVLRRTNGLTTSVLIKDLEKAAKYTLGYYKNDLGEYRYVKGIEVTNDLWNLCRMGLNGEDRGVWVHFCELNDRKAGYYDVPIAAFIPKHDPLLTKPEELMKPTTKEDFDAQVERTIRNICAPYPESVDPQAYLDALNSFFALADEFEDIEGEYISA